MLDLKTFISVKEYPNLWSNVNTYADIGQEKKITELSCTKVIEIKSPFGNSKLITFFTKQTRNQNGLKWRGKVIRLQMN